MILIITLQQQQKNKKSSHINDKFFHFIRQIIIIINKLIKNKINRNRTNNKLAFGLIIISNGDFSTFLKQQHKINKYFSGL